MPRKKLALYVEGQTEQLLINQLIKEWWQYTEIEIHNIQLLGDGMRKCKIPSYPIDTATEAVNFFLVIDIHGEGALQHGIASRAQKQHEEGYNIIGLRDLYTGSCNKELIRHRERVEREILLNIKNGLRLKGVDPERIEIFFSIMEIEAWLLAFPNALSKWAKNSSFQIPNDLEAILRPSMLMKKLGDSAKRGNHKSLSEMTSFVSSIKREEIEMVYKSNRVPSFSKFWSKIIYLTQCL